MEIQNHRTVRTEVLFKEIMDKNEPELVVDMNPQIQETARSIRRNSHQNKLNSAFIDKKYLIHF